MAGYPYADRTHPSALVDRGTYLERQVEWAEHEGPCGCHESQAWRLLAEELWKHADTNMGNKTFHTLMGSLHRLRDVSRDPEDEPCCDRGLAPGHAGRCLEAP